MKKEIIAIIAAAVLVPSCSLDENLYTYIDESTYITDASSARKSRNLAAHYEQLAREYGCGFLDAATVTGPSAREGLHLDRAGHAALGKAAARVVREMLE